MITVKLGGDLINPAWFEIELMRGHLWLKLGRREIHYSSGLGWTVSWAEPGWAE